MTTPQKFQSPERTTTATSGYDLAKNRNKRANIMRRHMTQTAQKDAEEITQTVQVANDRASPDIVGTSTQKDDPEDFQSPAHGPSTPRKGGGRRHDELVQKRLQEKRKKLGLDADACDLKIDQILTSMDGVSLSILNKSMSNDSVSASQQQSTSHEEPNAALVPASDASAPEGRLIRKSDRWTMAARQSLSPIPHLMSQSSAEGGSPQPTQTNIAAKTLSVSSHTSKPPSKPAGANSQVVSNLVPASPTKLTPRQPSPLLKHARIVSPRRAVKVSGTASQESTKDNEQPVGYTPERKQPSVGSQQPVLRSSSTSPNPLVQRHKRAVVVAARASSVSPIPPLHKKASPSTSSGSASVPSEKKAIPTGASRSREAGSSPIPKAYTDATARRNMASPAPRNDSDDAQGKDASVTATADVLAKTAFDQMSLALDSTEKRSVPIFQNSDPVLDTRSSESPDRRLVDRHTTREERKAKIEKSRLRRAESPRREEPIASDATRIVKTSEDMLPRIAKRSPHRAVRSQHRSSPVRVDTSLDQPQQETAPILLGCPHGLGSPSKISRMAHQRRRAAGPVGHFSFPDDDPRPDNFHEITRNEMAGTRARNPQSESMVEDTSVKSLKSIDFDGDGTIGGMEADTNSSWDRNKGIFDVALAETGATGESQDAFERASYTGASYVSFTDISSLRPTFNATAATEAMALDSSPPKLSESERVPFDSPPALTGHAISVAVKRIKSVDLNENEYAELEYTDETEEVLTKVASESDVKTSDLASRPSGLADSDLEISSDSPKLPPAISSDASTGRSSSSLGLPPRNSVPPPPPPPGSKKTHRKKKTLPGTSISKSTSSGHSSSVDDSSTSGHSAGTNDEPVVSAEQETDIYEDGEPEGESTELEMETDSDGQVSKLLVDKKAYANDVPLAFDEALSPASSTAVLQAAHLAEKVERAISAASNKFEAISPGAVNAGSLPPPTYQGAFLAWNNCNDTDKECKIDDLDELRRELTMTPAAFKPSPSKLLAWLHSDVFGDDALPDCSDMTADDVSAQMRFSLESDNLFEKLSKYILDTTKQFENGKSIEPFLAPKSRDRAYSRVLALNFVRFLGNVAKITQVPSPFGDDNPFLFSIMGGASSKGELPTMQQLLFDQQACAAETLVLFAYQVKRAHLRPAGLPSDQSKTEITQSINSPRRFEMMMKACDIERQPCFLIPPKGHSAFAAAAAEAPSALVVILDFLGDPVAVCRTKMLNTTFRSLVLKNEHELMRNAVRHGGLPMNVRPYFWLWVTLEKCLATSKAEKMEDESDESSLSLGGELAVLEKLGRDSKWHSVIERDVARSFGTLPPHKTGARLRNDSIVRALVSWGKNRMIKRGVNGSGEAPDGSHSSREGDVTPTDTVSDWGGVTPVGSFSSSMSDGHESDEDDRAAANAKPPRKSRKSRRAKAEDMALSGNALTEDVKEMLQGKLSYILHALSAAHPDVGYCQGMDYVVAHLLRILQETVRWKAATGTLPDIIRSAPARTFHMDMSEAEVARMYAEIDHSLVVEETCFRVMNAFLTIYDLKHMYWPELRHLKYCCLVFERLIKIKLPVLADHFEHHELNIGLFALGWFQTLFLYLPSMPSATVCHMWDIWIVERSFKIFFRVGTAILFLSQPILLNQELEGMMSYLNTFPDATLLSPDILIHCALQIKVTNRMLMDLEHEIASEHCSV